MKNKRISIWILLTVLLLWSLALQAFCIDEEGHGQTLTPTLSNTLQNQTAAAQNENPIAGQPSPAEHDNFSDAGDQARPSDSPQAGDRDNHVTTMLLSLLIAGLAVAGCVSLKKRNRLM